MTEIFYSVELLLRFAIDTIIDIDGLISYFLSVSWWYSYVDHGPRYIMYSLFLVGISGIIVRKQSIISHHYWMDFFSPIFFSHLFKSSLNQEAAFPHPSFRKGAEVESKYGLTTCRLSLALSLAL